MCPTELKMQPTIHFRISEKSWLLKLKYPAFFRNGLTQTREYFSYLCIKGVRGLLWPEV
jgi:hypothetical protein